MKCNNNKKKKRHFFLSISIIDQYMNEMVSALANPLIKFIIKPMFSFSNAKIEKIAPNI